jgi:L-fucose mutarotase/ribose pyranase (RbsD/FucU family)
MTDWRSVASECLQRFGHRNWLVVADAAYPAQSAPQITTLPTGEDHLAVLRWILDAIAAHPALDANIYLDTELDALTDQRCPGIEPLRREITAALPQPAQFVLHDDLIARLQQDAEQFQVLVLKSTALIPYVSVFLHLQCGYWSPERDQAFRQASNL